MQQTQPGQPRKRERDDDFEEQATRRTKRASSRISTDGNRKRRNAPSASTPPVEIPKVKKVNRIQLGSHLLDAWYFSPYPEELSGMIHVCPNCLDYTGSRHASQRHSSKCQLLHPPGSQIYSDGVVSFWQVDGAVQRTYCRNLSLLSKAFLDSKYTGEDVNTFDFYVMTSPQNELLGYFSKSKVQLEDYNLACILVLPHHHRKGYGSLLMELSYQLSARDRKLGTPEQPLSELGRLSYLRFWFSRLFPLIQSRQQVSINGLAQSTSMTKEDVVTTLNHFGILQAREEGHVLVITKSSIDLAAEQFSKTRHSLNPNFLNIT